MSKNILECHSKGDKRFSALFAEITIQNKKITIEQFYQNAKRLFDGSIAGKGKDFNYLYVFDKVIPKEYCSQFFLLLWVQYFLENDDLYQYACTFDDGDSSYCIVDDLNVNLNLNLNLDISIAKFALKL